MLFHQGEDHIWPSEPVILAVSNSGLAIARAVAGKDESSE
jgi:hypothetical protein